MEKTNINNYSNTKPWGEIILGSLIIILLPFEDSFLRGTAIGYAGASLSIIPTLLLFLYRLIFFKIEKKLLVYSFYGVFISVFYFFLNQSYDSDVTVVQGIKYFILYFYFVYLYLYFKNTKINYSNAIKIMFFITLLSVLLSFIFKDFLDGASVLHFEPSRNFRPRGFSLESSTYGFLCITAMFMFALVMGIRLWTLFFLGVVICFLIMSKGTILVFSVAVIASYVICSGKNFFNLILSLLGVIICYFAFYFLLDQGFSSDLESYTSSSTRFVMVLVGLFSLLYNPFGNGMTGFLPTIYEHGPTIVSFLKESGFSWLNFSEVSEYFVVGNTKNIGTKSFFFDSIIFFGFPFVVIFLKNIISNMKYSYKENDYVALAMIIFISLALVFYISGVGSYIAAVAFGIVSNKGFKHVVR
ncbi:hypothetical protein IG605_012950 [Pectobacterium quasiaquaticum]|uniref:hypothetical protein n=1 Tax=Pectobacterium quasiaquaticum TaxID=2774015 RepID=UPI0018742357|nr:hypothetical protein [Pectobacterium quasiaquaticum]MBE5215361.1 hypothetical protein [Pectobacterium quasiaquaticum]MBE5227419.1 hypothetical protein [Pectobacterium quasiaquaticum]URG51612.1 hypothetical protein IG605_012950 [Pectobacterium quasiaquaticum]